MENHNSWFLYQILWNIIALKFKKNTCGFCNVQSIGDGETVDMSAIKQEPPSNFGDDGSGDGTSDSRHAGGGKAKKLSR